MSLIGCQIAKTGVIQEAVEDAIDSGCRYIDAAHVFLSEKEVGAAIKNKIGQGVVKREELIVVSKLWDTYNRPEIVDASIKRTLCDLQLSYVDFYIIHWPYGESVSEGDSTQLSLNRYDSEIVSTWEAMLSIGSNGYAKSIGLSNLNTDEIKIIEPDSWNKNLVVDANLLNERNDMLQYTESINPQNIGRSLTIPMSSTPTRLVNKFKVFDFELTLEDIMITSG